MNLRRFAIASLLALGLAACERVEAGNVGVKVNLLGDDKGVQGEVVGVGRYWLGWNEELFIFPTFTQTATWKNDGQGQNEEITFQTVDGMVVSADVGITYRVDPEKVSTLFQRYRKGIDEITDVYLRNIVRDEFNRVASVKSVEYVYGAGKDELRKQVEEATRTRVSDIGLVVESVYVIGSFRFPTEVVNAINMKIQATQQAQQRQNEVATAKAEADKRIEQARGEAESIRLNAIAQAEANRIIAQSLTPEIVQFQAIQKWNGILPNVTGGAVPMINIGGK